MKELKYSIRVITNNSAEANKALERVSIDYNAVCHRTTGSNEVTFRLTSNSLNLNQLEDVLGRGNELVGVTKGWD